MITLIDLFNQKSEAEKKAILNIIERRCKKLKQKSYLRKIGARA